MTRRVLLVEDEVNIIEAIRFILVRDGWQVEAQSDGANAVSAAQAMRPDVIILDAMLPHRSGFDILADLRALPDFADTPILMLTARGQAKDRELALQNGATHYMTKPFSNAEVLDRLNTWVSAA
ncbi:MAG: response regulator transcription factor [Planktomarina sp.]